LNNHIHSPHFRLSSALLEEVLPNSIKLKRRTSAAAAGAGGGDGGGGGGDGKNKPAAVPGHMSANGRVFEAGE
jgi:hypothetical protein